MAKPKQLKSIQHYSAAKDICTLFNSKQHKQAEADRPDLLKDMRALARTQPLSGRLPVQDICVDVQGIASDANEPHKPLLL